MVIIESGQGKPYYAKVNDENRLEVRAVSESIEHHANVHDSNAFQMVFEVTPSGSDNVFVYIKNTDQDLNMIFEGVSLHASASAEQVEIFLDDTGTPSGGTDIVPVNVNSGSATIATGVFQQGSNITGLSGGSKIEKIWLEADKATKHFNFNMDVVLVPNATLVLKSVTGGIQLSGMLAFFYSNGE